MRNGVYLRLIPCIKIQISTLHMHNNNVGDLRAKRDHDKFIQYSPEDRKVWHCACLYLEDTTLTPILAFEYLALFFLCAAPKRGAKTTPLVPGRAWLDFRSCSSSSPNPANSLFHHLKIYDVHVRNSSWTIHLLLLRAAPTWGATTITLASRRIAPSGGTTWVLIEF